MNCLDFRRQLNIDPLCEAAEFLRHRQQCARCAEALERANAFEVTLRKALDVVPVSPRLADSILLAHATRQQRQRQTVRRGLLLAAAAALVLAFSVGVGFGVGTRKPPKTLQTLVVDHLDKEAFVLAMTQPIADDDVRKAFAKSGIALDHVPAGVSFVFCCPFAKYHSVHMVMPESIGPETVLYISEDAVEQRESFTERGWQGRSVPLTHGTLVLLARDSSHFDQVEKAWREALEPTPGVAQARI